MDQDTEMTVIVNLKTGNVTMTIAESAAVTGWTGLPGPDVTPLVALELPPGPDFVWSHCGQGANRKMNSRSAIAGTIANVPARTGPRGLTGIASVVPAMGRGFENARMDFASSLNLKRICA